MIPYRCVKTKYFVVGKERDQSKFWSKTLAKGKWSSSKLKHIPNSFMKEVLVIIETSPLICSANYLTDFYMIETSAKNELNNKDISVYKETDK